MLKIDLIHTAFHSGLEVYQWKVLHFNGVPASQQIMDDVIKRNQLQGLNVSLDNGGICLRWLCPCLRKNGMNLSCLPGITRLTHSIKIKNLTYFINDVKTVEQDRGEITASLLTPKNNLNLVKVTQPIDFKERLQSVTNNKY